MAVEPRRGCGYRRIGGTYLEGDPGPGYECGRLPVAIKPCPLCDQRPAFTRGLQRITPLNLLHAAKSCTGSPARCRACPLNVAVAQETAGLMWVGGRFYTPESFTQEAVELGPSKRVPWPLPRWFEIGATWVFLAHEEGTLEACGACEGHASRRRRAIRIINRRSATVRMRSNDRSATGGAPSRKEEAPCAPSRPWPATSDSPMEVTL